MPKSQRRNRRQNKNRNRSRKQRGGVIKGDSLGELVEEIGLRGSILHGGLIEHQQNRAMVQILEIPTRRLILDWEVADIISDAQVVITVDFLSQCKSR